MNLLTVVRPAQRILTGTLVAAVASTCLISTAAPASAAVVSPASVQAGAAHSTGAPGKKEYVVTPGKKEYKKEYVVVPGKKEYKKEYVVAPGKKEYRAVTAATR
jgi:hypothetical protein